MSPLPPGHVNRGSCSPNVERHRILLLPAGGGWCVDELGRDEDDVVIRCRDDGVEALGGDVASAVPKLRSWAVSAADGTASGRWRLRRRTSRSGTSNTAATTGTPRRRAVST